VWGSSNGDVFVVGKNGTILHYDGSSWSAMRSGTTNHLSGIGGSSDGEVFAVGETGTILHYPKSLPNRLYLPLVFKNASFGASQTDTGQ
jgi:hypothetical protein